MSGAAAAAEREEGIDAQSLFVYDGETAGPDYFGYLSVPGAVEGEEALVLEVLGL